jgi:hypothetical protein
MGAVLVTVAGPNSRMDLSLPADALVAEIVPALVDRCEPGPKPWSRWALGPSGGAPFAPRRTLAELGVVDGSELQLSDMVASGDATGETPDTGPAAAGAEEEQRRRSISDLTERLIDDIARIRAGKNPLLEYAAPEARRRLRALAPGPFDRAAEGGASDLSLAVSWHRDPRASVEAPRRAGRLTTRAHLQRDAGPPGERQDDGRPSLPLPPRRQPRDRRAVALRSAMGRDERQVTWTGALSGMSTRSWPRSPSTWTPTG